MKSLIFNEKATQHTNIVQHSIEEGTRKVRASKAGEEHRKKTAEFRVIGERKRDDKEQ